MIAEENAETVERTCRQLAALIFRVLERTIVNLP
jgi:hypothetical protein